MFTLNRVDSPQYTPMNVTDSNGGDNLIELVGIPFDELTHYKQESKDKVEGRNNRKRNDIETMKWLNSQISEVWEND